MTTPAAATGGAPTDAVLVQRVAAGEALAFRLLAVRHIDRAHAVAMRVLHNREDAEEAVQDTLGKVWRNAALYDESRAAFSTWFYRIVANAALDRLRRRSPPTEDIEAFGDRLPDGGENGEERWARGAEAQRIRAAVAALPPRQRLAVALCYFDDFTQPEAARIMNIHLKAFEGLLSRARAGLKRSIAP